MTRLSSWAGLALAAMMPFVVAKPAWAQDEVSLSAPTEAGINEAIEVRVSGAAASGDMVRFADLDGNTLGGSYAYVGNAKDGVLKLSAPLEPGRYQVVYLSSREIVAAAPLTVHAVDASLEAPERVGINESFEVAFDGPDNAGDSIQVTRPDGRAIGGLYAYTSLAKEGKVSLKAPAQPGRYLVTYQTGRKVIGQVELQVFGLQATLEVPDKVPAGAHFDVSWEGPDNSGDVIRIVGEDGQATGSYAYTGNNPEAVTLRAPESPGGYRVVYSTAGETIGSADFTVAEVSASLSAPESAAGNEPFEVAWEGPGNYGDVIELVPAGSGDDVDYAYVDPEQGQLVQITAPEEPGPHELRYITHGGRTLAARAIEISPPVVKPGSLQVLANAGPLLGAGDAVEIVLDASGSMLQRQDGDRRIDIAKRTLEHLISETIPAGASFAMRVFGHKEADGCRTDLEIPLGPLDRGAATAKLSGVNAMNLAKTPIADSLALTDSDLRGVTGERIIVLVTDGEETCEGDPGAVIAGMRARGQDIRFNIVGYAIDDTGLQETFERWATLGGGEYFNAADESQLAAALTNSVSPSFVVLDQGGTAVASGIAGGEPVTLMPGTYTVEIGEGRHRVEIESDARATLDLK